jgi:hypothetical protein
MIPLRGDANDNVHTTICVCFTSHGGVRTMAIQWVLINFCLFTCVAVPHYRFESWSELSGTLLDFTSVLPVLASVMPEPGSTLGCVAGGQAVTNQVLIEG